MKKKNIKRLMVLVSIITLFTVKAKGQKLQILITSPVSSTYKIGDTLRISWLTEPGINSSVSIGLRDWRFDPNLGTGEEGIASNIPNNKKYFDFVIPSNLGQLSNGELGCDSPVYQIALYLGNGGYDSFQLSTGFKIIKPSSVKIDNISNEFSILIYPNPATDILNINCKKEFSLVISDMYGREVKNFKESSSTTITITDLVSGQYVVTIISEKNIFREKIIKQ